ncbi:MAG: hypothetical protein L0338_32910 [Acidobacteria bacterium]|nr:hypothetical protein [Acidobacteriota bacterium]
MRQHPYLRAYMAGITVPTAFLLVIMTAFFIARHLYAVPVPVERVIVFPMAIIPNLFGVWNMLYVGLGSGRRLSIGVHGALLPFVLAPIAVTLAMSMGFLSITSTAVVWFEAVHIPYAFPATIFPVVVAVYYLIWKHLVGFLNELLGIA